MLCDREPDLELGDGLEGWGGGRVGGGGYLEIAKSYIISGDFQFL